MRFELHVWGPGFGLPSIDPTCLGAIAYLRTCLPRDSWALVATSDSSLNPLNELPALKDDSTWVAGFANIIAHLRAENNVWDLDRDLTPSQAADCAAYSSFIQSRGRPLLDLHLYVSTENWTECTRPALADLLSWPSSWSIPHCLREKARKSSEHLGLSGLDVDTAQDEASDGGVGAQIPQSLKKSRQTVQALLGHDTKRSRFRLDAVITDLLAPLEESLGDKEWLVANKMASVDCLCLGYLALMRVRPRAPQPWLEEALDRRFPRLGEWARRRQQEFLGSGRSGKRKSTVGNEAQALPWQEAQRPEWTTIVNNIVVSVTEATPILRTWIVPTEARSNRAQQGGAEKVRKQVAVQQARQHQLWYSQVLTSSVTALTVSIVLAYNGYLRLPGFRSQPRSTRSFGEAGSILGI
ncbi:Metaxin-like protein [Cyphellophora attinorum]|uniref:Metaxin-like protein n=1 Tax=Cyphellophora attinorum TaxID=1664694 RepID=A0A0N1HHP0_9EURO|nr:Metaxin-like protein [Phialophora attinorum]KPI45590.1 Metaxin-like protein [Phialophora attinorum]